MELANTWVFRWTGCRAGEPHIFPAPGTLNPVERTLQPGDTGGPGAGLRGRVPGRAAVGGRLPPAHLHPTPGRRGSTWPSRPCVCGGAPGRVVHGGLRGACSPAAGTTRRTSTSTPPRGMTSTPNGPIAVIRPDAPCDAPTALVGGLLAGCRWGGWAGLPVRHTVMNRVAFSRDLGWLAGDLREWLPGEPRPVPGGCPGTMSAFPGAFPVDGRSATGFRWGRRDRHSVPEVVQPVQTRSLRPASPTGSPGGAALRPSWGARGDPLVFTTAGHPPDSSSIIGVPGGAFLGGVWPDPEGAPDGPPCGRTQE